MRKSILYSVLVFIALVTGFCYGYFAHRNRIFPYKLINNAYLYNIYRKSMQWSIGIYEGDNPFNLSDNERVDNPILSARDVTDIRAAFVADPFVIKSEQRFYMFFEVLNRANYTGDIAYAVSDDGLEWQYGKVVLDEDFHLSYPSVFEWNDEYYIIPESSEDNSVRLYRSVVFPDKWEYLGNMIEGYPINDPTVFYRGDMWWMFTSGPGNDILNLYYSDSLATGWKAHPMNPILENSIHIARPAGRVFEYENKLYRLAQDDFPYYGMQVFAVEITELSESVYRENSDSARLIVTGSGKGWNSAGMHHVDLFREGEKFLAAVDGIRRRR
jgi:hypothetical protein